MRAYETSMIIRDQSEILMRAMAHSQRGDFELRDFVLRQAVYTTAFEVLDDAIDSPTASLYWHVEDIWDIAGWEQYNYYLQHDEKLFNELLWLLRLEEKSFGLGGLREWCTELDWISIVNNQIQRHGYFVHHPTATKRAERTRRNK